MDELLNNPDAMAWAEAFVRVITDPEAAAGADPTDPGFMVGWFANAMSVPSTT